MATKAKQIRSAIIGYGASFGMGPHHVGSMLKAGIKPVAVCDIDPTRTAQAMIDNPEYHTYPNIEDLLAHEEFELATIITPHNCHAPLALQCLEAGKHVITEKPMCITADEANAMVELAKKNKRMVSVFHNRRWDGDYLALKEILAAGLIGDIFRVECFFGGYHRPGTWWRADKEISGGAMYDWGAHFMDWILGIVPGKIKQVTGFIHNRVWNECSNEDEIESILLFESGAVARLTMSSIARIGAPKWRVLGTRGAILDVGGKFQVNTEVSGIACEMFVPHKEGNWHAYYENIADHLYNGAELIVKPEQGRRTIAVIETTEKAARAGKPLPIPYE